MYMKVVDVCFTFIIQIFVIIPSIFLLIKTPSINSLYGYRTRQSSKNEETWRFANKIASIIMIIVSVLSIIIGCVLLILKYCLYIDINFMWFMTGSLIGIIIMPVLITEILLAIRYKKK